MFCFDLLRMYFLLISDMPYVSAPRGSVGDSDFWGICTAWSRAVYVRFELSISIHPSIYPVIILHMH